MWYSTPFTVRLVSIAISFTVLFSKRLISNILRVCSGNDCRVRWRIVRISSRKISSGSQASKVDMRMLSSRFLFLLDFRSQHHVQLYGVSSRELYFSRSKVKELLLLLLLGGDQSPILHKRIGYDIFCYHIIMYVWFSEHERSLIVSFVNNVKIVFCHYKLSNKNKITWLPE